MYKCRMNVAHHQPNPKDSKWLNSNMIKNPPKRVEERQIAIFKQNQVIGFEEIIQTKVF